MSTTTTYLITGANRGLGRAAVEKLLARPNVTLIATVRDPSHPTAQSLSSLPKGTNTKLLIITLNSTDFDPAKLAKTLKEDHGLTALDVVLHSAAICQAMGPLATATLPDFASHVETNGYGTLNLFQGTVALLEAAPKPKFIAFGSPLGSIGGMERRGMYPLGVYGASKALVHFLVRRIHFEHEKIAAVVVDPGFVQTDMGNAGAQSIGMEKALDEVEPTILETLKLIDAVTKEEHSGRFIPTGKSTQKELEGKDFPW